MVTGEGLDSFVTLVMGGVLGTLVAVLLQAIFEAFNPTPWNLFVNVRVQRRKTHFPPARAAESHSPRPLRERTQPAVLNLELPKPAKVAALKGAARSRLPGSPAPATSSIPWPLPDRQSATRGGSER